MGRAMNGVLSAGTSPAASTGLSLLQGADDWKKICRCVITTDAPTEVIVPHGGSVSRAGVQTKTK